MKTIFPTVEVIGGGLIGTSIALRVAKNGGSARVIDVNEAHQRIANELLGASLSPVGGEVDLVVVATPVSHLSDAIIDALQRNAHAIVIDTGSIKTKVVLEVWTKCEHLSQTNLLNRFVPTHPMAGREISGPDGARADLFAGRAWVVTPHEKNTPEILAKVESFIHELGASSYRLTPENHDLQVAMTSHLPQLLASALAGVLTEPLDLAGQGLRDMTRLAHSDPSMWASIFEGNKGALTPLVNDVIKSINSLVFKEFNQNDVISFMRVGNVGARKVPGKHGGIPRNYGALTVVIPDRPGQLAALFNHAAEVKINIEDLRIEHSPGQEQGLITLFVQPVDLSTLNNYLSTHGWHCTISSKGN